MIRLPAPAFVLAATLLALPAAAQDGAELVVRLNRIEGQMRQLSGQVEQLGFENRQLRDQLRKFQEDTEFRFNERSGSGGRSAAPAAAPSSGGGTTPSSAPSRPARRSDAFEPDANPDAPGTPRPLGSPSGAVRRDGIASLIENDAPPPSGPPAAAPRSSSIAGTGSDDPRADYDAAYAYLIQKQYESAEMAFRRFLQSHPRDRLVPDAVYGLGESYLLRNRPREAAEQFLKVSTEHARSAKAPDAMLKLGVALSALGAKDQACATLAELERKYPGAAPSVKQGVDREQKRARCPT